MGWREVGEVEIRMQPFGRDRISVEREKVVVEEMGGRDVRLCKRDGEESGDKDEKAFRVGTGSGGYARDVKQTKVVSGVTPDPFDAIVV